MGVRKLRFVRTIVQRQAKLALLGYSSNRNGSALTPILPQAIKRGRGKVRPAPQAQPQRVQHEGVHLPGLITC
jgi:hypothetical protein